MSYGGFLALNLALSAPERVTKLVLLAPAGSLLPFRIQFYLLTAAFFLPLRAVKLAVLRREFAMPIVDGAPVVEQLLMGTHFRGDLHVFPRVFTDRELRHVKVPTLILLGEHEVIYDPRTALNRAAALIPNVETALVPGARHRLTLDQPQVVNARLTAFLGG